MTHNPEMVKIVVADPFGERIFWVSEMFNSSDCLDRAGEYSAEVANSSWQCHRDDSLHGRHTNGNQVLEAVMAKDGGPAFPVIGGSNAHVAWQRASRIAKNGRAA